MSARGDHKCKQTVEREAHSFDASAILGTPFPVILHNGVTEQVCEDCGAVVGHVFAKPRELIAATAILRAFKPAKLNGAEIKFLRKSLGLKAKELAEEISTTAETLSRLENDRMPISEQTEKLLRASVCLRHVDQARGLDVNIPGLFAMKLVSVWPADDLAIHLSMQPVEEDGKQPVPNVLGLELMKKWSRDESSIAC